jgi:PBSX family phage terminase large subunit
MKSNIKISTKQKLFLKAKNKYVVFRGGIGSGKSRVLVYKAILNACIGRKGLVLSNSFAQSRDVILATFKECLPLYGLKEDRDYTLNKSEMDIILWGTYIHLRSCEQSEKLRGINCSDIYIDEARNMKNDEVFLIAIGRMRESKDGQCFISTSPRGKDWVWQLSQKEGVLTITQKTEENPFLPQEYIDDLRDKYAGLYAKQELDADIVEFGSGIISINKFIVGNYVPVKAILTLDIAVSTKTSADYSAICIASNQQNNMILHDIWRDRVEYSSLKDIIASYAKRYSVSGIYIEDVAAQRIVIDDLKHNKDMMKFAIRAYRPKGDKLARALPWVSRVELNQVKVQEGAWNKIFFEECSQFNGVDQEHDDMIDAVSMAYDSLYNTSTIYTKRVVF